MVRHPLVSVLRRSIPALRWLPAYRSSDLRGDLTAGLTTAVMLIPQAMAYALLAGLPPIVGLYAAVVPLAVYALFGSSRELSVGPVALDSLLLASGIGVLAHAGTGTYVAYAVMVALAVGATQLVMGLARLGFLVNFLSRPVISGFTSAAAIVIGASQLGNLLGIPVHGSAQLASVLGELGSQLGDLVPMTAAIGLGSLGLLVWLRRAAPMFPAALVVVALATVAVFALRLDGAGVAIVGAVPAGLPHPSAPWIDFGVLGRLWPTVLTIALIGFMEAISVAKAMARRRGYEVDANQELVGLGLANLAGGLFGAYPVAGGFSRTAVNAQAGARTPLASLITAGVIALALVFFTPAFYYLPKTALAAVILAAVIRLVDWREVVHLARVKRSDLALLLLTFAATLGIGVERGILVGVGASLLWFVVRATKPHVAVLGRVPGTTCYRNLKHFPEAETYPGLLLLRVDAQLYFGNVAFLKDILSRMEARMQTPLRAVVLDASSVNQLDSSADSALHEIAAAYAQRGISLVLANVKGPVMAVMRQSKLCDRLGACAFHLDMHSAVEHARQLPRSVPAHSEAAGPKAEQAPAPALDASLAAAG